jgi:hypothetical protein
MLGGQVVSLLLAGKGLAKMQAAKQEQQPQNVVSGMTNIELSDLLLLLQPSVSFTCQHQRFEHTSMIVLSAAYMCGRTFKAAAPFRMYCMLLAVYVTRAVCNDAPK